MGPANADMVPANADVAPCDAARHAALICCSHQPPHSTPLGTPTHTQLYFVPHAKVGKQLPTASPASWRDSLHAEHSPQVSLPPERSQQVRPCLPGPLYHPQTPLPTSTAVRHAPQQCVSCSPSMQSGPHRPSWTSTTAALPLAPLCPGSRILQVHHHHPATSSLPRLSFFTSPPRQGCCWGWSRAQASSSPGQQQPRQPGGPS